MAAGAAVTLVNGLGLPFRRRDIAVRPRGGPGSHVTSSPPCSPPGRAFPLGAFVDELEQAAQRYAT